MAGLLVIEIGTSCKGESASSATECFQLLFMVLGHSHHNMYIGEERLFYILSERSAQAAFTLQMETLLPLTTLLKYGKSIAESIQSPKWLFFGQVIPFIVISNFTTINSISHIFHNLVILVTLVFNIKYTLFPLDWKCNYRCIFFHFLFFFKQLQNNIKMPVSL